MNYRDYKNTSVPCYKCTDRHMNCHSECNKYSEYKKETDRVNEIKRVCKSVSYNKHFI